VQKGRGLESLALALETLAPLVASLAKHRTTLCYRHGWQEFRICLDRVVPVELGRAVRRGDVRYYMEIETTDLKDLRWLQGSDWFRKSIEPLVRPATERDAKWSQAILADERSIDPPRLAPQELATCLDSALLLGEVRGWPLAPSAVPG
jgi:hypothetical protein